MTPQKNIRTMTLTQFINIKLLQSLFNLGGLCIFAWIFYKFVPLFITTISYSYIQYLLLFSIFSIVLSYIEAKGNFTYLFSSFIYFLLIFAYMFFA